jgi:hypothetical protein
VHLAFFRDPYGQVSCLLPEVGFLRSPNTVILVKRLNREKFCPDATSFLTAGSSVYIAGVGILLPARRDLLITR